MKTTDSPMKLPGGPEKVTRLSWKMLLTIGILAALAVGGPLIYAS